MHFREVNKKLNQLKANVVWANTRLIGVNESWSIYEPLVNNAKIAHQELEDFRNTTLAQLSSKGV